MKQLLDTNEIHAHNICSLYIYYVCSLFAISPGIIYRNTYTCMTLLANAFL